MGARPRSLTILQEQSTLRRGSALLDPLPWPPKESSAHPRALRSLSRIVEGGLCHRCGSCVGICPTGVLAPDTDGYPSIAHLSACTDCDLCVRVCPGDEFDFTKHCRDIFAAVGDIEDTHGSFLQATVGHASDPFIRKHSTSGGLVTAILLQLLEAKAIDGALVIVSDHQTLWKGKPIIARTKEDLLASMKSKYAICPTNEVFSEIRQVEGRYAIVGLPCQIHGYHKAAALDPRLKSRIVLSIGLFCHAAIEHDAFRVIWETLPEEKRLNATAFTSRIGKHPGAPHVHQKDGSLYPLYFGSRSGYRPTSIEVINVLYRLFTPERCTTCFDGLSEFADISIGDPWLAPPEDGIDWYQGWSFALLRTPRGLEAYKSASDHKAIFSVDVTRREAMACNRMMATEKRHRAFRVIETRRRQGKAIPAYGPPSLRFPKQRGLHFVKTELHMLSHTFCFLPHLRAPVLRFFMGPGGYWLFYANSKRRALRVWFRDTLALVRRKMVGRS